MSEYAQQAAEAFAQAREFYEETERWLASQEGVALTHAKLEDQLGGRGRELQRLLFQAQQDLRALDEQRRASTDCPQVPIAAVRANRAIRRPVRGETPG
jgi:hypothetical protein